MAGRLKRERDARTGTIVGYIFDGQRYDPQQFNRLLQSMLAKGDPWAKKAVETLDDFRSLRGSVTPKDQELLEAEVADIDATLAGTGPKKDITNVERVQLQRRRKELLAKSGTPHSVDIAVETGKPSYGQLLADASERRKRRDAVDQYKHLILTLERALGRKPTKAELDQFISFLSK